MNVVIVNRPEQNGNPFPFVFPSMEEAQKFVREFPDCEIVRECEVLTAGETVDKIIEGMVPDDPFDED